MQQRVPVPGDVVWIRQRRWLVERSRRHGDVTNVDVLNEQGRTTFLTPFDRIVAPPRRMRLRDVSAANTIRRFRSLLAATASARAPASAIDADVRLWPFQLEPVLALIEGIRRIVIADEVGLGKTIQAGVAIADICRRRAAARVLVVVPASLGAQWSDELTRRFAIPALGVDACRLERSSREAGRDGDVWLRRGVWIASVDFLKQPHVIAALPREPWDLVVFDEAHALCGDSQRYEAASALATRARALLLLTATPHNGDTARFDRLLALGAIPGGKDDVVAFRRTRADLGLNRTRRVRWMPVTPSAAERDVLDTLIQYERAAMRASRPVGVGDVPDAVILLLSVFRKRALSSMQALDISLRRRLAWVDRATGAQEADWQQVGLFDAESDALSRDDAQSLTAPCGLEPAHERLWLCRLIRLTGAAIAGESKMTWLRSLLRRTTEPVVVFTEFRHTLEALQHELLGVRILAALHGGQTPREQQAALGEFIAGSTTLLLATDVASQGLNMQARSRWVICFDLPWDPVRLEQRVGRVDRLGQTRSVHATMMVRAHPAEAAVLRRIATRVLTAGAATHDVTLGDWDITEDLVRRKIIAADPIRAPSPPSARQLPVSAAWSRLARETTRHLERRRQFRSPGARRVDAATCTLVTRVDRFPDLGRLGVGDIGIYTVPLLDRTGDVVEQRLIAIDFRRTGVDREWLCAHREQLDHVVGDVVRARRRRLATWLRRRAERLASTERALQTVDATRTRLTQVGLFDRREATNASMHQLETMELDRIADTRVEDYLAASVIDIGAPVLELLLVKRA